MNDERLVVLEISRLEAAHLAGLVEQFVELLVASDMGAEQHADPALARLVPDAYPDDADAAREFREITQSDLLARREADARALLATLPAADGAADGDDPADVLVLPLDPESVRAWMRTLTAVRLVLASRLGIESEDDHDEDDPRFGTYDWLGFRLDGLIQAADRD